MNAFDQLPGIEGLWGFRYPAEPNPAVAYLRASSNTAARARASDPSVMSLFVYRTCGEGLIKALHTGEGMQLEDSDGVSRRYSAIVGDQSVRREGADGSSVGVSYKDFVRDHGRWGSETDAKRKVSPYFEQEVGIVALAMSAAAYRAHSNALRELALEGSRELSDNPACDNRSVVLNNAALHFMVEVDIERVEAALTNAYNDLEKVAAAGRTGLASVEGEVR